MIFADATQTDWPELVITTFTQVKRSPRTAEPFMTRTGVLAGYSPAIVEASLSQSRVSQSERTLTIDLSALSLYRMQFCSGVDCTMAGDEVANGVEDGVGCAAAGVGLGVGVGVGVAVVKAMRRGVGCAAACCCSVEGGP